MEQKFILIGLILIALVGGLGLFFYGLQQEPISTSTLTSTVTGEESVVASVEKSSIEPISLITSVVNDVFGCSAYDLACFSDGLKAGKTVKKTYLDERLLLMTKEKILKIEISTLLQVKPIENEKYEVTMKVTGLKKIDVNPLTKIDFRSDMTYADRLELEGEYKISDSCPLIMGDLETIKSKTKTCIVSSLDEARKLQYTGLDEKVKCENQSEIGINETCEREVFYSYSALSQIDKPAVYLYPETKTDVSVTVKVNGFITKSIPEHGNGWEVIAEPSGLIDNKYDYLFYEVKMPNVIAPDEGWVVESKNIESWFNENLPKMGLNEKETSQFNEYWVELLQEAKYYEIKLIETEFLNKNMKLDINPQPDTIIRLIFSFRPIAKKITLLTPTINTPERKGFTVVEWGGLIENGVNST